MSRAAEKTRETAPESKRDRVRRLLITPMQEAGFRFKQGTDPKKGQARLNQIIDDVAYMSDDGLAALCQSMMTKGDGSNRTFWPSHATFVGFAEAFEKRPLEELPKLIGWFASQAGRDALQANRLVAEYLFWQKFKRPPFRPEDIRSVTARAKKLAHDRDVIRDRQNREVRIDDDELRFMRWYDKTLAHVTALVEGVQ